MEWEVGGGLGMGKTCKPKAVSFQCMTKFTKKKKKKKSYQKKKKRKERLAYSILLLLLVDPMMLPALQITTPHW